MKDWYPGLIREFLRIVYTISSREHQYKYWIDPEVFIYSDYSETVCHFFDDYNAEEFVKTPKEYGINEEQHQAISKLYYAFDEFDVKHPGALNEEVVDDPEWEVVRCLAKDVLEAFSYEHKDDEKL